MPVARYTAGERESFGRAVRISNVNRASSPPPPSLPTRHAPRRLFLFRPRYELPHLRIASIRPIVNPAAATAAARKCAGIIPTSGPFDRVE